jgi:hypothetical protein
MLFGRWIDIDREFDRRDYAIDEVAVSCAKVQD